MSPVGLAELLAFNQESPLRLRSHLDSLASLQVAAVTLQLNLAFDRGTSWCLCPWAVSRVIGSSLTCAGSQTGGAGSAAFLPPSAETCGRLWGFKTFAGGSLILREELWERDFSRSTSVFCWNTPVLYESDLLCLLLVTTLVVSVDFFLSAQTCWHH